jgi:hypothetical protein
LRGAREGPGRQRGSAGRGREPVRWTTRTARTSTSSRDRTARSHSSGTCRDRRSRRSRTIPTHALQERPAPLTRSGVRMPVGPPADGRRARDDSSGATSSAWGLDFQRPRTLPSGSATSENHPAPWNLGLLLDLLAAVARDPRDDRLDLVDEDVVQHLARHARLRVPDAAADASLGVS